MRVGGIWVIIGDFEIDKGLKLAYGRDDFSPRFLTCFNFSGLTAMLAQL